MGRKHYKRRAWTTDEEIILCNMLNNNENYSDVAKKLKRSKNSIRARARRLGFKPRYTVTASDNKQKADTSVIHNNLPRFDFVVGDVVSLYRKRAHPAFPYSEYRFDYSYNNKHGKCLYVFTNVLGCYKESFTSYQLYSALSEDVVEQLEENNVLIWSDDMYVIDKDGAVKKTDDILASTYVSQHVDTLIENSVLC